jgi:hypothetical protein
MRMCTDREREGDRKACQTLKYREGEMDGGKDLFRHDAVYACVCWHASTDMHLQELQSVLIL